MMLLHSNLTLYIIYICLTTKLQISSKVTEILASINNICTSYILYSYLCGLCYLVQFHHHNVMLVFSRSLFIYSVA